MLGLLRESWSKKTLLSISDALHKTLDVNLSFHSSVSHKAVKVLVEMDIVLVFSKAL
jgi:hypothetical protein